MNNRPYKFNKAIVKINKTSPPYLCNPPKFLHIAQDIDFLRKVGKKWVDEKTKVYYNYYIIGNRLVI